MDSNQREKQKKSRSDRHKNKTEHRPKRSEKRSIQLNKLLSRIKRQKEEDLQATIKYERPTKQKQKRNRSDRHREREERKEENKQIKQEGRRSKKTEKKGFVFTFKHTIVSFGVVFVLALIAYTTILYGGKLIVDEEKLIISPPTTIETEDGDIVWYLYDQYRLPVELDQVPDHVKDAFVAIEDKRFYSHSGVDIRSVVRAIYRDIVARSKVEGGSTLTQQLAKNLFLTNDKSWLRKIKEVMIALYLEREFTKDEILEMYLNVVYFGQGQYGIEAAANKYFYKSVEDLTLEEGALLAGMVKAPNGYSPIDHLEKAQNRRNLVLTTMSELDYISVDEAKEAQAKNVELNISQRKYNPAHHAFVDIAIQEAEELYGITLDDLKRSRYRLITSLDETAQTIAFDQFQQDGYFPGNNKEDVEGAFVMMEQESGEIVAAIGGRHFQTGDLNRVVKPIGQPGSTMKPLAVYAPALETELFTPYSTLPDELQEWDGKPVRNYNDQYDGAVTFYNAIKYSKNTSSVWLLNEIGVDYAKSYLKKMKIDIEDKDVRIALGDLKKGLSPLQLVQSYRTFVHGGKMIDAHTIIEVYNRKGEVVASANPETTEVFSDQVAWNMTEMLKDVVASGTGQSGYYPHELAGKTGTTQHPKVKGETKDAWFVGFTPEYVTALWMGYDDISQQDHFLTGGSSYPTELTKKILTELDKQRPLVATFTKPENVQALAEPIELPNITDLSSSYVFGGLKIVKGKLEWTGTKDKRIIYRVYEENGDKDEQIGEVNGENEFVIDKFSLFDTNSYYVVPYDPLAQTEGQPSNVVKITF
ncbi:transglycosylase domain-containing protein [Pseudogracilibacillus auburnensis]|uniref:transglycosylase domain-containing protein n=1 Tax=Pseudogracilibacillus auburnensis TaxID=1494959 RepID=UPI001A95B6E3|nr:PBP1A family penicillin-binding protein [Pseudogracilibacillus auburnensis]MBO1002948.1 PBP1A family penicillin-binding protein [Pseudogracilibacillus auburnensis]